MVASKPETTPPPQEALPGPRQFRFASWKHIAGYLSCFFVARYMFLSMSLTPWSHGEPQRMPGPPDSNITSDQKARLQEVADLLLEVYKTLAEMRYLDPAGIQPGSHDIGSLLEIYREEALDPSIIYLYSILPYIDTSAAGNSDFFHGGSFAEFRVPDSRREWRDPLCLSPEGDDFNAENGPYMQPWTTPLSRLGNHQSVLLYDAHEHRIWIVDQIDMQSTDPALKDVPASPRTSTNQNSFRHLPSRDATTVLRDINTWYRTLKVLPGGGETSGGEWSEWDIDLRDLYRKHGWPGDFDSDAFEVHQARAYSAARAKYFAEEPMRAVEDSEKRAVWLEANVERCRGDVAAAKTHDDEWVARYELWTAERLTLTFPKNHELAVEKADKFCPGGECQKTEDLPLWELAMLQSEYEWKADSVENERNWMEMEASKPSPDLERMRTFSTNIRHAEITAIVYRKAYEASKADAERLCPGRTLESATGIKHLGVGGDLYHARWVIHMIAYTGDQLVAIQEWATLIPEGAGKAHEKVRLEIERLSRDYKNALREKESSQRLLAQYGEAE